MILTVAVLLVTGALFFTLFVRSKDLPEPEPVSPFQHLDETKARIYENLRDLQFEYRLGKLSDEDYQKTKADLQKELTRAMAEIDKIKAALGQAPVAARAAAEAIPAQAPAPAASTACPHCGAKFEKALKFCGECGKPMGGVA